MSKKTKTFLFVIAAVFAAILITLTIVVKVFITPERIKTFLIPQIESALNRKITIDEVHISLFKGIRIKNFSIKEKDEKTDFVRCDDFVLKYQLLPLFFKKIFVDELILLSPDIRITRNADGIFNFADIGKKPKPEDDKKVKQDAETKKLPIFLQINNVVLTDARFSFVDFKEDMPDIKGSVNLNAGIKSSEESQLSSEGTVSIKLDEVMFKKTSKKYTDLAAGLKYAMNINFDSHSIKAERADLKIQELPLSLSGTITNYNTEPEIDLAVSATKIKTSDVQKSFASFFSIKGLTLSGNLTSDLSLRGMIKKPDTLHINGKVGLQNIGIAYNNVNASVDGNLIFKERIMDIDLRSTVGKNSAELTGNVSNYFKNQKIKLNLHSKQLVLDDVVPVGAAQSKTTEEQKGKQAGGETHAEAKPLSLKLAADGEIRIDSAQYRGIMMNNFYTKYELKNNIFKIEKMNAGVGKGTVNAQSVVDLSKPGYAYNLVCSVDSVHADEMVNAFAPKARDTMFGILSATLTLSGTGTKADSIKSNLNGTGNFIIRDGKITNNKLSENLAVFLGIEELKIINLKTAQGTVKIGNSIARLDSIFSSDDIVMDPSGNVGLDQTLDLAFDLKLSPRLTQKAMGSGVAKYIRDDEGWGLIPLKVSGTFAKPSYSVDVAKAGKRVIKKKAQELLEDIFNKDKTKEQDESQRERKPIEDLLKGIFK